MKEYEFNGLTPVTALTDGHPIRLWHLAADKSTPLCGAGHCPLIMAKHRIDELWQPKFTLGECWWCLGCLLVAANLYAGDPK